MHFGSWLLATLNTYHVCMIMRAYICNSPTFKFKTEFGNYCIMYMQWYILVNICKEKAVIVCNEVMPGVRMV